MHPSVVDCCAYICSPHQFPLQPKGMHDEVYTIVVQLSLFRVYMSQVVREEIHINCFLHHSYNLINIIRVCVVVLPSSVALPIIIRQGENVVTSACGCLCLRVRRGVG